MKENKDSILILGAGLMQRPAIRAARELGLKTFVIDANPAALCAHEGDAFEKIDLKDKEKIAEYAVQLKKTESLKAIFTAGTDFSASVAYVAEKAGIPNHSYQAALNASDKSLMRSCFKKNNVPSPAFFTVTGDERPQDKIRAIEYPCVVKPVDNMGARGCRMVRSSEELEEAIRDAVRNSRTGRAIVEEYMDGKEYSIDALVYDGTMTITGFADRHIFFPPYFIETGHTMPSDEDRQKYLSLVKTFALGVKALGLTQGAAKADIKYTKKGPMIGEIAARLSGGYMSGWTYPYSSELDLTKQAVLVSLGKRPELLESGRTLIEKNSDFDLYEYVPKKASAERAWISIPGVVKEVIGLDKAKECDFIKDVLPRSLKGDRVTFPRNNVEKCGNVISCAPDIEKAVEASENAVKKITVRLEKNNPETEKFLNRINHFDASDKNDNFPPAAFTLPESILKKFLEETAADSESNSAAPKKIPDGAKIKDYIPQSISSQEVLCLKDFNHLTLSETIAKFDDMCPSHGELEWGKFFRSMIQGGIQGALYEAE